LVIWWIELCHRMGQSIRGSTLGRIKWALLSVNCVLYIFLIIVVIIYALKFNQAPVEALCGTRTLHSNSLPLTLSKAYKIVVCVLAFIIALGFMIYGTRVVTLLTAMPSYGTKWREKTQVLKLAFIASAARLVLVLQCALLLYSTFKADSNATNTVLAISLALVVEVLPGAVICAAMRQPQLSTELWEDLCWCIYEDAGSTGSTPHGSHPRGTSSGPRSTRSRTRKTTSKSSHTGASTSSKTEVARSDGSFANLPSQGNSVSGTQSGTGFSQSHQTSDAGVSQADDDGQPPSRDTARILSNPVQSWEFSGGNTGKDSEAL